MPVPTATRTIIGGVMQHIEEAGIHSRRLGVRHPAVQPAGGGRRRDQAAGAASWRRRCNVKGLMNIQFAVTGAPTARTRRPTVYVLEVNPRASRTVPFVSKATGVPLARLAALVMVGKTLDELGVHDEVDADALLGEGERLPVQQVPRRGHHPRPGDAVDRRGDGHRRRRCRWRSPRARWRRAPRCRRAGTVFISRRRTATRTAVVPIAQRLRRDGLQADRDRAARPRCLRAARHRGRGGAEDAGRPAEPARPHEERRGRT